MLRFLIIPFSAKNLSISLWTTPFSSFERLFGLTGICMVSWNSIDMPDTVFSTSGSLVISSHCFLWSAVHPALNSFTLYDNSKCNCGIVSL